MKIEEGFVESEGHRLAFLAVNKHLLKDDKQPVLVFIHGILASINFWRDCVPPGFQNRPWYSLSLPGHHPSTVPENFESEQVNARWFFQVMNGALKALLGGRKAIIIGHSTGGFCALNLAANRSPHVAAIISVAGFHSGKWEGAEGLLVKFAGLGGWTKGLFVAGLSLSQKSSLMQRYFAGSLANDQSAYLSNPLSRRILDNLFPDTSRQNYADLFPLFHGIGSIDIAGDLNRINIPSHIFAGSHDPVIPMKQSLKIMREVPGAKTTTFQNCGHMPFVEDTENYFRALEQALSDIMKK